MVYDNKRPSVSLPPGLILFPGETPQFIAITSAIQLFEATGDGAFVECNGKGGERCSNTEIVSEPCVVITNFRTCFQPPSSPPSYLVQFTHLSISQIDTTPYQLTITLKFSPSKYLFKFSKPKISTPSTYISVKPKNNSSLCEEFADILKKHTFSSSIETTFPFKMGRRIVDGINEKRNDRNESMEKGRKKTLEDEIIDQIYGEGSSDESDDEVETKGLDKDVYMRVRKLGWARGYKIQKEFERMQINKDVWCISTVNEDFTLSPTYPQDFIFPTLLLKQTASSSDTVTAMQGTSLRSTPLSNSIAVSPSFRSTVLPESTSASISSNQTETDSLSFFKSLCRFRSRGRFPILCWKQNRTVLMRSGQPMVGFLGTRGLADEFLIREVVRAVNDEVYGKFGGVGGQKMNKDAGKNSVKICVLDARGYASAFGNGYSGGGYENIENYPPNTTLHFLGLPNIHSISSSHTNLLRAISSNASAPNWFSVIESTGWLGHVADLLKAAGGRHGVVGRIVDDGASVLVHCTDGWDRTTQLVSLAQIMLDPYFRTIKGFQVLIEKEWLAFGHPFRSRGGLPLSPQCSSIFPTISSPPPNRQLHQPPSVPSPVFLLFLTCVHHLIQQNPDKFEYNDFLLLCLARAAGGNSPYGDFLCNSERERTCVGLRENTISIWEFVRVRKKFFINTAYRRPQYNQNNITQDTRQCIIELSTNARSIGLWEEYYFPKDDISISLLCTPLDTEFVSPHVTRAFPRLGYVGNMPGLTSEYYLANLFIKRRRRRLIALVWRTWRGACRNEQTGGSKKFKGVKRTIGDDKECIINNVEKLTIDGNNITGERSGKRRSADGKQNDTWVRNGAMIGDIMVEEDNWEVDIIDNDTTSVNSNGEDETENEETKINEGSGQASGEQVPRMVIVVKNTHEHEGSKGIKSRLAPQPVSSRTSKSFPRSSAKPSLKSPKTLSKPSIAFPYVPHSSSSSNSCPRSLASSSYDWVDVKNEEDEAKTLCELLHEAQRDEVFRVKRRKSTGKNSHMRNCMGSRNGTANEKAIAYAIRNATNELITDKNISSHPADTASDETITTDIPGALPSRTFVDNYFSSDLASSLCLETSAPDSGEFVFV
ncbi:5988_t:CDS:2 [Paraglomus brasilianum]|uniref:5988_t:CDS:1 n=1 Tax=Paraglomus brasilianum TaxID=144538 RepID=A0A9N9AFE6_9GLOM|nr:5988_t:CDS:2 [Paraglomus brasilianum]